MYNEITIKLKITIDKDEYSYLEKALTAAVVATTGTAPRDIEAKDKSK